MAPPLERAVRFPVAPGLKTRPQEDALIAYVLPPHIHIHYR